MGKILDFDRPALQTNKAPSEEGKGQNRSLPFSIMNTFQVGKMCFCRLLLLVFYYVANLEVLAFEDGSLHDLAVEHVFRRFDFSDFCFFGAE